MKNCSRCHEDKSIDCFNKEKATKDGYSQYCKDCRKAIRHQSYLKNKDSVIAKQFERRRKSQDWVRQFKTKCQHCGETHPATLDFHHTQDKDYGIASLINRTALTDKTRDLIKIEVQKCIILCSNCHRKLHWEDNRSTAQ